MSTGAVSTTGCRLGVAPDADSMAPDGAAYARENANVQPPSTSATATSDTTSAAPNLPTAHDVDPFHPSTNECSDRTDPTPLVMIEP
jgi:hypothetical protein